MSYHFLFKKQLTEKKLKPMSFWIVVKKKKHLTQNSRKKIVWILAGFQSYVRILSILILSCCYSYYKFTKCDTNYSCNGLIWPIQEMFRKNVDNFSEKMTPIWQTCLHINGGHETDERSSETFLFDLLLDLFFPYSFLFWLCNVKWGWWLPAAP